ncbi:MAG TPA: HlyC/CorC family transporter [Caldithrix abyssi]|uniref:HlyC/CorC family transporter n=1 Tax=Caldithrix abyssi TaxID=187145 RepID=A0A7V5LJG9_CALAY|nr:HlyC/CorC family transporter [Caldisericaceae bacterium]HHE54985.1 HlyC/CorC family transporter [Caldithrix abyssi]
MDPASLLYLLIFVILLILSAFFSASETAYFSLAKSSIEKFSRSKNALTRQVATLLKEPRRLLISIIIGNTLVNVAIASIATLITSNIIVQYEIQNATLALLLNVVVVTFVILFFSEILPKITAIKNAKKLSTHFALPLTFFHYLFYPVSYVLDLFTQQLSSALGADKNKFDLTEKELRTLVDVGEEQGALRKEEKEMIHGIFEMSGTVAREIMVPRTDMICLGKHATLNEVLKTIKEHMHSRIPVYDETIDNIVGILYVKDLLAFIKKRNTSDFNLEKIVRPTYYVPETKKINELLREFQAEKIHMAIVVDEYGGTSGLVTLEDVIEEIVGEIQDEYDKETPQIQKINESTFLVDGGTLIDEINEELGLNLPTEEGVDTLAGFLLGQFGSVPKNKDKIDFNGYQFIIEKATKKRIQQVRIILKKQSKPINQK